MSQTRYQHDAAYKNLFKNRDMVASLIRCFAPPDVVAKMDFSSLEPFPTEHIAEDLRERRNDIIWRIRLKNACRQKDLSCLENQDQYCYLLFLLEFQSREDWWMAVRILAYTALLWQEIIKAGKLGKNHKLPPVFPLVLYNGGKAWGAPTDLRELLFPYEDTLAPYQPQQRYAVLDAGRVSEEALTRNDELATLLIRFERAQSFEEIKQLIVELGAVLPSSKSLPLHRAFISWLGNIVFKQNEISKDILHCSTIQEACSMLADIAPHWEQTFMEKGRNEGISIGRSEGIAIGEARGISIGETIGIKNILQEILNNRFGTLPNDIMASIDSISNTNELKKLTHEAYQVSSFKEFTTILNNISKQ